MVKQFRSGRLFVLEVAITLLCLLDVLLLLRGKKRNECFSFAGRGPRPTAFDTATYFKTSPVFNSSQLAVVKLDLLEFFARKASVSPPSEWPILISDYSSPLHHPPSTRPLFLLSPPTISHL